MKGSEVDLEREWWWADWCTVRCDANAVAMPQILAGQPSNAAVLFVITLSVPTSVYQATVRSLPSQSTWNGNNAVECRRQTASKGVEIDRAKENRLL